MKWYGSIDNRMEEGRQFCDEIKVGTGVTEYYWSDRHAYEVIAVKDQKHITIRKYDTEPDGEPMSNKWKLVSNKENPEIELTKRGKYWYTTTTATIEDVEKIDSYRRADGKIELNDENFNYGMWFIRNEFDPEKIRKNGKQVRYHKMNISIGKASYYYDYEF